MAQPAIEPITIRLESDDEAAEFLADDDFEFDDAVLSSDEIGQSFVTSSISLARPGTYNSNPATLLVLKLELGAPPGNRHRFKSASIFVKLKPLRAASPPAVSIIKYSPESHHDTPSEIAIQQKIGGGGSLTVHPAGWGLSTSAQRSSSYTRHTCRKITGASSGKPVRNQVHWALEENSAEKDGIWENFRLAMLVRHAGQFSLEVAIKVKVGFSADPRKMLLRALRGHSGARVVDPSERIGEGGGLDVDPDFREVDIGGFTSFGR